LQMLGNEPRFHQLLDPIGRSFVQDFCTYFSDSVEDDGSGADDPAPTPEVTP
jgi:hypothetical protein